MFVHRRADGGQGQPYVGCQRAEQNYFYCPLNQRMLATTRFVDMAAFQIQGAANRRPGVATDSKVSQCIHPINAAVRLLMKGAMRLRNLQSSFKSVAKTHSYFDALPLWLL
jgi:hypothetical protein